MICVRLMGGLGNQLFQYAAGRALSLRHGCELLLDVSKLGLNLADSTPRTLSLHHFQHVGHVVSADKHIGLKWLQWAPAIFHWLSPWRLYLEKGCGYNHIFSSLPNQTYLVGYWQSFHYFTDIAKTLSDEMQTITPLSTASQAVAAQIGSTNSVAVHVRRGDYVSLELAARFHGALDLPYYLAALAHIHERVYDAQYFVFSDDMAWCREHLPFRTSNTIFVDHNTTIDAWQDLDLMSRCRHHVIANSSFSWWGAWLADQRCPSADRIVIAPVRWFARAPNHDINDRLPPQWIRQA